MDRRKFGYDVSVRPKDQGKGVRSHSVGGGVCYSVAPWLRKFVSIHSRKVGSKLVWDDITHSCYDQVTVGSKRWCSGRAVASHQCAPGSNSGVDAIWVEFVCWFSPLL